METRECSAHDCDRCMAAESQLGEAKKRLTVLGSILIEAIGAEGPENADVTAGRAVERIRRLETTKAADSVRLHALMAAIVRNGSITVGVETQDRPYWTAVAAGGDLLAQSETFEAMCDELVEARDGETL